MKKIFTLLFALIACTFFVKAQTITDNFESYDAFTVDPAGTWTYYDGDGGTTYNYNAVTVPNLPYVGSCIVMNPSQTDPDITDSQSAHGGSQFLAIYNAVPSTITSGSTTNDWVISPEIPFTNGGDLSFWARELTDQYGSEVMRILYSTTDNNPSSFMEIQTVNVSSTTWQQYSYSIPAGAKFVAFNCTSNDIFALFIDDITISFSTPDPIIVTNPSALDFGEINLPGTASAPISITGYNLTENLTATVTAPFEISANGTSYSSSITITPSGGTLYVRYAPTAQGTHNGTLTLTSGTTTATVPLTGKSVDCSEVHNITYTCEFNTGDAELNCWQIVDANSDGYPFLFAVDAAVYSYNTNGTTAANDWLISPEIALGNNARVSFNYKVGHWDADNNYEIIPERFGVYVIPEDGTYANAIQVAAPTDYYDTAWAVKNVDLAAYSYQTVRIAIHISSPADMFRLWIDHFVVDGTEPPTLTSNVSDYDFGRIRVGTIQETTAILTSTNLNEPITVTVAAPYSVSIDGVNFATSVTIPANPATLVDDNVYIQFAPETAGSYTEVVTATTSTLSVSITLKGAAFDCDTITEFTFTEDFEESSETLGCWDVDDANLDDNTFTFEGGEAQYVGNNAAADDWLYSPVMNLTGNQILTFDCRTSATAESFIIVANSGGLSIPLTETLETSSTTYENMTVDLRTLNGTYRLAIHCVSAAGASTLYIDNFVVREADEPFLSATPASMEFTTNTLEQPTEAQTAEVTGSYLVEDITVSTAAPFEISTDGSSYSTSATIAVSGLETSATLYVRYNPTEEGTQSGTVSLTSGTATTTITLNGTAETVGISEHSDRTVSIYPNPATTILNVTAEGYDNLQIVNAFGQVVYTTDITGQMKIDVSTLSNGVYFIRLNNAEGTITQKFIKR